MSVTNSASKQTRRIKEEQPQRPRTDNKRRPQPGCDQTTLKKLKAEVCSSLEQTINAKMKAADQEAKKNKKEYEAKMKKAEAMTSTLQREIKKAQEAKEADKQEKAEVLRCC